MTECGICGADGAGEALGNGVVCADCKSDNTSDETGVDLFSNECLFVTIRGDGKAPDRSFGGWQEKEDAEPTGRNAMWDHDGTTSFGPDALSGLSDELKDRDKSLALLDVDGVNLLVIDHDIVDEGEEPDVANGKWPDEETLDAFIEQTYPGQLVWESQSGGKQVPVVLDDEAFMEVYENSWRPGYGVDSIKGPAAKGYTLAPFSPGYGVWRDGEVPMWSADELGDVLVESATTRMRSADPDDYEPVVTRAEAHSCGETDDIDVMLAAINQLTPSDFEVPYPGGEDRGDGTLMYDPAPYRSSSSGESLVFITDNCIWYDQARGKGMFSDKLVALEAGIISDPHDKLEGAEWWAAVERLRELGAPVPEWTGPEPEWVTDFEAHEAMRNGGDAGLLWEIRRDYAAQQAAAVAEGVSGHLVGPKGCGKTHNAVQAARDDPVAVFAPTKQKYREILDEAEEAGLDALRLPSFPEHSPLWDDWEDEYLRGAFPRELYNWDERDPEDIGQDEYKRRQDLDFDDYDLLVGAPVHAFVESVIDGRVLFFDDADLDAFKDVLDRRTKNQINTVLEEIDHEANSWKDLRTCEWAGVERALVRHTEGPTPTGSDVWEALQNATEGDDEIDRRAFLARIPGADLDVVDWMRALTGHLHSSDAYEDRGMRLMTVGDQHLLVRAPDLSGAAQVFTMGAWPAEGLEQAFEDMGVGYDGMFGSKRHADMERAINRFVIQTSEHVHNKAKRHSIDPETGERRERINPERIEAIAEGVRELGGELGIEEDVHVFSTKQEAEPIAEGRGESLGDSELVANYGSLVGTNEHSREHLAVAGASQHFGDDYVKIRATYAGASPEDPKAARPFEPRRWEDGTHAAIERRMRRSGLYESITRMGRNDTEPTIVAADTAELPPWLQVIDQSDKVGFLSPSARDLYEHIKASDGPVFIKDGEGGGAVEELDYSGPALYAARDELLESGLVEGATEGKYGSVGYEDTGSEPGNPGITGLSTSQLPGSSFREARNPDWDVIRLDTPADAALDSGQTAITGAGWGS